MKRRFWLIMTLILLSVTLCGCINVEFDGWPAENGEEGDFGVHLPGVSVDFNAHPVDEAVETPTAPLPQETAQAGVETPPQETRFRQPYSILIQWILMGMRSTRMNLRRDMI